MKVKIVFKSMIEQFEKKKETTKSKFSIDNNKNINNFNIPNSSINLPIINIINTPQTRSTREFSNSPQSTGKKRSTDIRLEFNYLSKEDEEIDQTDTGKNQKLHGILLKNSHFIADLKSFLSIQSGFKIDTIELYTFSSSMDKIRKINDDEYIKNFIANNLGMYLNSPNFLNDSNLTNNSFYNYSSNETTIFFYYKLNQKQVKVEVEYFQNSIDKILFELSTSCQIFMLKYLINKKLKGSFPINEQSLTIIGLTAENESQMSSVRELTNINSIEVKDGLTLEDIINIHQPKNNLKYNSVNLLLARKGQKKCSIGLDFSFAILKNLKKIEFDNFAPSYREASDGINIFCYCRNSSCVIYNQMFVKCLGFGKFDIIREIENFACPRCKCEKFISARNIGFIHCEWSYRGLLSNKNNSIITGDGFTIDDKIYAMNEVDLLMHVDRLEISVKENDYVAGEVKIDTIHETQNSSFDDMDIQFSVRRKDLFKEAADSWNTKNFENYYNQKKNKNLKFDTNIQNLCNLNNNAIITKSFDLESNRNVETNNLINNTNNNNFPKNDKLEIKIDKNTNYTCCSSYFKNDKKESCNIY